MGLTKPNPTWGMQDVIITCTVAPRPTGATRTFASWVLELDKRQRRHRGRYCGVCGRRALVPGAGAQLPGSGPEPGVPHRGRRRGALGARTDGEPRPGSCRQRRRVPHVAHGATARHDDSRVDLKLLETVGKDRRGVRVCTKAKELLKQSQGQGSSRRQIIGDGSCWGTGQDHD